MYFSIIVPVYNRPAEVDDLLKSLTAQSCKDFEVLIVEDGSTVKCRDIVEKYVSDIPVKYFYKENEGRSIARNYGIERAVGDYFVFFDSDCVIPADYISVLKTALEQNYVDCFGGPDAAHESFSDIQKAINFSMTAFLTTGGIRGGKVQLEKFVPRSFNMGYSRRVWQAVGGFREMFSEDIDMSMRIRKAGFSIALERQTYVYHKRRVDLKKFCRQVYVFGMSRITLYLLYPESLKLVHLAPAVFSVGLAAIVVLACVMSWWWLLLPAVYALALFATALAQTRNLKISLLAIVTSFVQLIGYGIGFIRAWFVKVLMRRGRDIEQEIRMRKGK
ncbi:MAG: glycosyltransferase [Muribaculaceae bacterium]